MELEPIQIQSADEIFERKIEAMILSGELKIGDRLPTESELAEKLKIGKGIVHRGVVHLADRGFLRIVPRHGVFVADYVEHGTAETLMAFARVYEGTGSMNKPLIISTIKVRVIIESSVIRELALAGAEARLARPLGVLREMREALAGDDPPDSEWFGEKLAEEFHCLCMASENISIPIIMNPFNSCCAAFSAIWVEKIGAEKAVSTREGIYELIKAGDGDGAVTLWEERCERFFDSL